MYMYSAFSFEILSQHDHARVGRLTTPHGVIETPAFIFCGTKASIKGLDPQCMRRNNTQIILSNTYHLHVYPGSDFIRKMGGLHRFMSWDGPMFTDSGGFQIFSLGHGSVADEIKGKRFGKSTLLSIDENGVVFKSYRDGSLKYLTPEKSIEIQCDLGADIIVSFDECTPFHVDKKYTESSMLRSHRWEKRSLDEFFRRDNGTQALYGIVQGGVYEDLRVVSCDFVNEHDFFGHAIGGSLGACKSQMYDVARYSMSLLRKDRPVHLLGIGGLSDIVVGSSAGIDTFDCVHPTRIARHGAALVPYEYRTSPGKEHITLSNSIFQYDELPIDPTCHCATCQQFSRAYLHYLIKAQEMLAISAISEHNVHFMNRFMQKVRDSIMNGSLMESLGVYISE